MKLNELTTLTKIEPFPYSKITTIDQCVEAFQYLTKEIENISMDIKKGIDLILFNNVLQETINLNEYKKVTKNIEYHIQKVDMITHLINNFLTNNTIEINNKNIQNKQINIQQCIRIVDLETSEFNALVQKYYEGKEIETPSIDFWIGLYKKSIQSFNQCIAYWNRRYNTQIQFVQISN
jgi:hypothetical protein